MTVFLFLVGSFAAMFAVALRERRNVRLHDFEYLMELMRDSLESVSLSFHSFGQALDLAGEQVNRFYDSWASHHHLHMLD